MSTFDTNTISRLSDPITIEITDDVRDRHLAAIEAALAELPTVPVARRRPRRAVLLAAAALLVLPIGAAIASDSAAPGDVLYPVKMAVEPIVAMFGSDVRAERRVDELERLVDRTTDISEDVENAVERATDAVRDLPESHPIREELDRIIDRIHRNQHETEDTDRPAEREATDTEPSVRTDPPVSDSATTTTTVAERHRDATTTTTSPSTTTTTEGDRTRDR